MHEGGREALCFITTAGKVVGGVLVTYTVGDQRQRRANYTAAGWSEIQREASAASLPVHFRGFCKNVAASARPLAWFSIELPPGAAGERLSQQLH